LATQVALIALGDDAAAAAIKLARELWQSNVRVELLAPDRGLKALMRRANKLGVPLAIIVGENEIARGVLTLRDLRASTQREIPLDTVTREVVAAFNASRA
jgi:histidyl-tRNA synthetase